jgi:transcriptional regulator with XRE-family HTH domain
MQLATYLDENGISDAAFARSIGVERQAVGRYRSGERFPEKVILLRIFEVTGGQVTANDFAGIEVDPAPEPERATS